VDCKACMAVCGVFERAMITMVFVRSGEGVNEELQICLLIKTSGVRLAVRYTFVQTLKSVKIM
jgi:hypothetical protein